MNNNLHIFNTPEELAARFADELSDRIANSTGEKFHLAISGGSTPNLLFSALAAKFAHSGFWEKLHIWWVDERMVPPTHAESNFGVASKLLLRKVAIPNENVHRIEGENIPEKEAERYSGQICKMVPEQNGWPVFDLILLGMGDDGHTASIFPDQLNLLQSDWFCEVATHPVSGQKRVTLTGKVINRAAEVIFMVTGPGKADRLTEILNRKPGADRLPATHIHPETEKLSWYLDQAAAAKLSNQ